MGEHRDAHEKKSQVKDLQHERAKSPAFPDQDSRQSRKFPPRLADGGGPLHSGRSRARGHSGQQARGRRGTPKGSFHPRTLWWRADRHPRPRTFLPTRAIRADDAWCENPRDRHYNRPVRMDRDQAGDRLARADHLYDFIVEIDHNTSPRVSGRGSAVFLHLARDNFGPTAGCVSMTKEAMRHLLRSLGRKTKIVIG